MSLRTQLDRCAGFDAEYGTGLSNHLPMALAALHRLGADDARLAAFARGYAQQLRPAPAAQPWPAGDPWRARLGEPAAWSAYRDLFDGWLASEDAGQVLHQVLPVLMQGCGAAAFHGLLRTAIALQTAHRQELIDGLAYWACRWLDLGAVAPEGAVHDPETLLRQLRPSVGNAPLIFQRMQLAARQPGFDKRVAQLKTDAHTLPRLSQLAAMAYAASGNFVALHLVTSTQALQTLLPYLDTGDVNAALRAYWRAFAAAVCAAQLQPRTAPTPRPWPVLVAQALSSADDHVIKLVDACREHERALGRGPWRAAATRALTL